MAKNSISKISNAFATGGGGVNFEQQIQAMFLLSLLVDGFCPAMNEPTVRVCFQAKHLGYDVDDLVVFTLRNQNEGKMLCQVKHSITATAKDSTFQEVISAAWSDFNKDTFDKENDKIALVTAQISNSALRSLRFLHAQAIGSVDEQEFVERVNTPAFSNAEYGKMLDAIKDCVAFSMNSDPSNAEIWHFCKAFILLLFDVDCEESVNRALSSSLIKCNSSLNALLVWSRLVEYAGRCNQTAASIDRNNIDKTIQELFTTKETSLAVPEPIAGIDLFVPTIAVIGAWREDNTYDRKAVEKISGISYSEFESKARNMLSQNSDYLKLVNGNWQVMHKEELLSQCKGLIFDDFISRLFEMVKNVLAQNSKRVMSKTPYYISSGSEYDNSYELRSSLVKSICWVRENLKDLPNCNHNKADGYMICLVRDLLKNAEWTTWASLRDCLQDLAQLAPEEFLDRIEWHVLNKKQEMLCLFPQKNSDLFGSNNYISELLWALETLAWSPDYLIKSICTLGLLEALPYERTNWANTPINSIVSILLPWCPQTLADFEKRKNALKSLRNDNPEIFWKVLNKLLPNKTTSTTGNPKPQYMSLSIPEDVKVTNAEVRECYSYLLELAVEIVHEETEKQLDLVDQIEYMYEQTLSSYLDCLEKNLETYTQEFAFTLWMKLRERLLIIKPTEKMVIYGQLGRINHLIDDLEPDDKRLKYRELYLSKRYIFESDNYATTWERIENEKATAIRDIFERFGAEETEQFGYSVKNLYDVASKLGHSLSENELSDLINLCSLEKISQEFTVSCISTFVLKNSADSLLNTSLCNMDEKFILHILTGIPFSMRLLNVIEKLLFDDSAYWECARMPFLCRDNETEELKLIVDKLKACKRYVTATNIVGRSDFKSTISAEYIYNLLKLAGTEESIGSETLDDYAVQKIIGWLQNQECIDLNARSDIEFIYLPVLGEYSETQPRALNTRLSLYPDYFCSMVELYYKKHSEEKHEVELNKGLSERLFKILFNYSITPGVDWNGVFSKAEFKKWMDYVKVWSEANDRYAVTMHTVGSGLSFAKLDEDKLPEITIIEELNKPENNELRRGYYLGVINQRGVHLVDPEGKPEMELSEDYMERANIAESKGYARYADVLRNISAEYAREAERNIESSKSNNME